MKQSLLSIGLVVPLMGCISLSHQSLPDEILSQLQDASIGEPKTILGIEGFETLCVVPQYSNTKDYLSKFGILVEERLWISENSIGIVLLKGSENRASELPAGGTYIRAAVIGCFKIDENQFVVRAFNSTNSNTKFLELSVESASKYN